MSLRRLSRLAAVAAVLLAVLLAAGTAYGIWTVRRSFPQLNGEVAVPGLSASVEVLRDEWGVPQLYADDAQDLFYAQGYVHAQDRFFEMDFRRHVTAGRLAELFGADQVESDRFIRTLGWRRVAEAEIPLLDPETRRYLQAYADGVNAYLGERSGSRLALEYAVLGLGGLDYEPEPWTPADSVAWLKAMAWDLRANMKSEIDRTLLTERLSRSQVEELYPPYPYARHAPVVRGPIGLEVNRGGDPGRAALPAAGRRALADLGALLRRTPQLLGPQGTGLGSNAWVVSGDHTTSGRPLLANDPHLGPAIPSVWYQMGLHCRQVSARCPFDVAGFTFSGLPGVVIGHNDRIAWGFTNLGADVTDLYLERVEDGQYLVDGELRPLETRTEVIEVSGGEPVTFTVRSSGHGPLISDASEGTAEVGRRAPVGAGAPLRGDGYAVALQWTALEPGRTADALFALNVARSWEEFRAAAGLFEVPAQNMVYADVDGNIGYQAPGRIPVRAKGNGRWPAPGWNSDYDWSGYVPFGALPSVFNPAEGYVVTANNAVVRRSYPYLLSRDWDSGYRSERIEQLLTAQRPLDVADMARIQADTRNPNAAFLVPFLLQVEVDRFTRDGQDLLRGWDFTQPPDSAAAAYFNAVWRALLARTFHDQLPADVLPDGGHRWFEVMRRLMTDPISEWWDDAGTKLQRETRTDIVELALADARLELTRLMGKDPAQWSWGMIHKLELEHPSLGKSGVGMVEALVNRGPVRVGGGDALVNATGWNAANGYQVDWVPSMRMVVDLADFDASRWVNVTGASGHPFHPHYADQVERWRDGETTPWPWSRPAVDAAAEHRLVLQPAPNSGVPEPRSRSPVEADVSAETRYRTRVPAD